GGLGGVAGAAEPDEERGDDRGGLDRHPQYAEAGGQHRQRHGADEARRQEAGPAQVGGGGAARLRLGGQVGGARQHRRERHGADHDQHEGGERVGAQQPAEAGARALDGQDRQPHRRRQDGGRRRGGQPGGGAAPAEHGVAAGRQHRHADRGDQQGRGHQSCSSRRSSRSLSPNAARIRAVRIWSTSTASSTSREIPSSTMNGTPVVVRNATAVMPLSIIRNPATWDRARRRVTSTKKPSSTTVTATGTARVAGVGASATTGRITANDSRASSAAATSEEATFTSGSVSRIAPPARIARCSIIGSTTA